MSIKNIKSFVVGAMVAFACACFADSETVNGFTWHYRLTTDGKGTELYREGDQAAVEPDLEGVAAIPAKLGGKPVVALGEYSVYGCGMLTEISIPSTVTRIEKYAFADICCFRTRTASSPGTARDSSYTGTAPASNWFHKPQ